MSSLVTNCLEMLVLGTNRKTRQTFCGRSANLQEQSQNGLLRATDDWQDRFHPLITAMNSDNVVMWATLLSVFGWGFLPRLRLCLRL